jgi:acyl carrier protein
MVDMTILDHVQADIRRVLQDHGRLRVDAEQLPADADLYQAGLTACARENVMLALEGEVEVEFPKRLVQAHAFRSIASIERTLRELIAA